MPDKHSADCNPVVVVQRTEHLTGKSRNLFLSPNFLTLLANHFISLYLSLSICRKAVTMQNCFA